MKNRFFIYLAIGILVVFGLLLLGFFTYEPAWFKYHAWQMESDNPVVWEAAVERLAAKGGRARPYLEKWLESSNDKLVICSCLVLMESGNTAAREAAIEKLAARGEPAIPYIKQWLQSDRDIRVINACKVLQKMDEDAWKQALPELERILK